MPLKNGSALVQIMNRDLEPKRVTLRLSVFLGSEERLEDAAALQKLEE